MLLFILGVVVIVVGLAGLVLPGLPGTPLVFAGSLLIAWADGFERVGWFALLLIGMLALVSAIADYGASVFGAKKAGASAWGVAGAFLGLVVGLPFGIPGIVLGPIVGATALEYFKNPQVRQAARAGAGVVIGLAVGVAVKCACAFAMVGVLVVSYLF